MSIGLIEYLYPMSPILLGALLMIAIRSLRLSRRKITIYYDETDKTTPEYPDIDHGKAAKDSLKMILQDFSIVNGGGLAVKRDTVHALLYDYESRPCVVTHERTKLLKQLFSRNPESSIMLFSIASYRLRIIDNHESIG